MKNKNCGIYKITSPTGKVYIGQSKNIKRRFLEYEKIIRVEKQVILYKSFKKYGWENHQFDIIEYCTEENLNCSERFWQDEFDVLGKNGLNCILTKCDSNPALRSVFSKIKISNGKKGIKNPNNKFIICEETGIFYDSLKEASKAYNISHFSLSQMLCGRVKNKTPLIYSDYIEEGKLSKDLYSIEKRRKKKVKKKEYKVINYTTKEKFFTLKEAAKSIGLSLATFCNHINKKVINKTDFIYIEEYEKGFTPEHLNKLLDISTPEKIIDLKTKKIYTFSELSNSLKVKESFLRNRIKKNLINNSRYLYLSDYDSEKTYYFEELKIKNNIIAKTIIDYKNKKEYKNYKEAAKEYKISNSKIIDILKGINYNTTNLMFLEDYKKGGTPSMYFSYNEKSRKKVKDKNSGKIYNSIREASRFYKIDNSYLSKMLRGEKPNITNLELI